MLILKALVKCAINPNFKGFHWSKIQNLNKKLNQHETWLLDKSEHADSNFLSNMFYL